MKWTAAEPLFSAPLHLTESRWLIQMSRLCLSCLSHPLMGFSLDLLGYRAESSWAVTGNWVVRLQCSEGGRSDSGMTPRGSLLWVKQSSRQGNCTTSFQREREQEPEAKMNKRDLQRLFRGVKQNKGGLKKQLWWSQQERSQMFRKDHWEDNQQTAPILPSSSGREVIKRSMQE